MPDGGATCDAAVCTGAVCGADATGGGSGVLAGSGADRGCAATFATGRTDVVQVEYSHADDLAMVA